MNTLATLTTKINKFIGQSELNEVPDLKMMRIFDTCLVCVAAASDPMFVALQAHDAVGPSHMTPEEWLPGAQSVISYFLPFSREVRKANWVPDLPAIEWLYARIEGQQLIDALSRYLVEQLVNSGCKAVAPALDSRIKTDTKLWRSNWSERHAAFIAGLGTFGLNKSLITEKGCAGRIGSVITNLVINPTARSYSTIYEYCDQCASCIACIQRCPANAIRDEGKDVFRCANHVNETKVRYAPRYGCAKCQTKVACEHRIPRKISQRERVVKAEYK